jgi:hypothetical protein
VVTHLIYPHYFQKNISNLLPIVCLLNQHISNADQATFSTIKHSQITWQLNVGDSLSIAASKTQSTGETLPLQSQSLSCYKNSINFHNQAAS